MFAKSCLLYLFVIILCQQCRTLNIVLATTVKDYQAGSWPKQVKYFRNERFPPVTQSQLKIIQLGCQSRYSNVVIACIRYLVRVKYNSLKELNHILLMSHSSAIRLEALQLFVVDTTNLANLDILFTLRDSDDWLIREQVYKSVRLFKGEKQRKRYFANILASIEEGNIQVLIQIGATLKWYNDAEKVLPVLRHQLKQASPQGILICLMGIISKYKNKRIIILLKELEKNHSHYLIRQEAKFLLQKR